MIRIVDWSKHFENNRTRELKSLLWAPLPNKFDGDGYTEMVAGKGGAEIYGCWVACVLVASRCDPRGTLVRDCGLPHDSVSLSRITRLPRRAFDAMIERALSAGWLEHCDDPAPNCEIPAADCEIAPMEGKGMEGNGREKKGKRKTTFSEPTVEEVVEYCRARGNSVDAAQFVDFYASKGWRVGNQQMKDWRAAVRTWEKRDNNSRKRKLGEGL